MDALSPLNGIGRCEMKQGLRGWFQRHPLMMFYLLAFLFSWLGWIPQLLTARGVWRVEHPLLTFLGGGGPTLAAVLVVWLTQGRQAVGGLFARLFDMRAGWRWLGVVLVFWIITGAVALGLMALFTPHRPELQGFSWGALAPVFVAMLLSNVWEEIGWRGFALPRFQERFSDWHTALIMSVLWSVWHLPLLLNPDHPMSGLPWGVEWLFSLSLTVMYIWLYRQTRGSLFYVTVFHALSNTLAFAFLEWGVFFASYGFVVGAVTLAAVWVLRTSPSRTQGG